KMNYFEEVPAIKYIISPFDSDKELTEEHETPVIVAEKATTIETLTVSDAVMKMDLHDLPALMFINRGNKKLNIVYYRKDGEEFKALGELSFRAKQLWQWVYVQGEIDFFQMSNLPLALRTELSKLYTLERASVSKELISQDETRKWLLKFPDNNEIETVFIPEKSRGTLCVSSQVGCTLTCSFCHTGTQPLVKNLSAQEILAQILYAKDNLQDWPASKEGRKLTNVVMMGMGEPLLNYENVSKALKIAMNHNGLDLSKRKITLSTSGIVPLIEQCGNELGVNLAISLHAVRDDLRNILVPINKRYPLKELLEACKNYPALNNSRRITFEYVMLKNVNDSKADAKELNSQLL
ncbi:radical SAM enzyme, partial [Reticulomyxa filosa]